MSPIEIPESAKRKLFLQMTADVRKRLEHGPPQFEHAHITWLWSELIFILQFARFLLEFSGQVTGRASSFVASLEASMEASGVETLGDHGLALYRALTTKNPELIDDENLRKLVKHARLMQSETVVGGAKA